MFSAVANILDFQDWSTNGLTSTNVTHLGVNLLAALLKRAFTFFDFGFSPILILDQFYVISNVKWTDSDPSSCFLQAAITICKNFVNRIPVQNDPMKNYGVRQTDDIALNLSLMIECLCYVVADPIFHVLAACDKNHVMP